MPLLCHLFSLLMVSLVVGFLVPGVWDRGTPSPLLFLLVTKNLTAIFNRALHTNFLSWFDPTLPKNINYLMFADDLFIITKATRISARNILFCLNLYANLTGQRPNLNKYAFYFPSWFNKRVSTSIAAILGIKLGFFPFTYLEAPISPFRLPANHFWSFVYKTASTISNWNHNHISQAGRIILLNTSIFSLPVYYLSIFYLPNSILDSISKLARNFLWGR